jgi:hypothetical protein
MASSKKTESYWENYFSVKTAPLAPDSAEVTLDKKTMTATVRMNFYFYGSEATSKTVDATVSEISSMYNEAVKNRKININGEEYTVKFEISSSIVTEYEARKLAADNTSHRNNFIRIEKNNESLGRSFIYAPNNRPGDNSGFFNTDDNLGVSTTATHETGHALGLGHSAGDQRGKKPDIMAARGTAVDAKYTWNPKEGDSKPAVNSGSTPYFTNTLNPQFRKVSEQNINDIFKELKFNENFTAKIGTTSNTIFDQKGYPLPPVIGQKKLDLIMEQIRENTQKPIQDGIRQGLPPLYNPGLKTN